jgi:hypothetical protein
MSPSCEATRILESFELCLIPEPPDCSTTSRDKLSQGPLRQALEQCFTEFAGVAAGLSNNTQTVVGFAANSDIASLQQQSAQALYAACCEYRQAVIVYLSNSTHRAHCATLAKLGVAVCPPPPVSQSNDVYAGQIMISIQSVVEVLSYDLLDCICYDLLPRCPPDPGDDRLILACITINNGKIVSICNFSCRKFAGSFPSLNYWFSIVPIAQEIRKILSLVCCSGLFDLGGGNRLAQGNYAWLGYSGAKLSNAFSFNAADTFKAAFNPGSINLATLANRNAEEVTRVLGNSKIQMTRINVSSAAEVPAVDRLSFAPFVMPGESVNLYVMPNNIVAGFASGSAVPTGAYATRAEVDALRAEIESLRSTLNSAGTASSNTRKKE